MGVLCVVGGVCGCGIWSVCVCVVLCGVGVWCVGVAYGVGGLVGECVVLCGVSGWWVRTTMVHP